MIYADISWTMTLGHNIGEFHLNGSLKICDFLHIIIVFTIPISVLALFIVRSSYYVSYMYGIFVMCFTMYSIVIPRSIYNTNLSTKFSLWATKKQSVYHYTISKFLKHRYSNYIKYTPSFFVNKKTVHFRLPRYESSLAYHVWL